jgi:hypothetical protein
VVKSRRNKLGPRDVLLDMRWRWAALCVGAALAAGAILLAAGAPGQRPEWRETSPPPLSPREFPTGFWTGEEVILVGGSDAPPCPPWASCAAPTTPPLADGAAYDPRTDAWRPIAEAPVAFSWSYPVVAGSTAYLWVSGEPWRSQAPNAFLAYRIGEDRWEELDLPTAEPEQYHLVGAGDRVVAVASSGEDARPDLMFDPAASAWSELPDDPFTPGFDRIAVWNGEELLLFDHGIAAVGDNDVPLRGAAFDFESGLWRELDDPDGMWARVGPAAASPAPPEAVGDAAGTTEVIAGDDRFVFLGSSWPEGDDDGELHARAWFASFDP